MNVLLLNASPHPAGIVSQALDAAASTARQAGAETVKADNEKEKRKEIK